MTAPPVADHARARRITERTRSARLIRDSIGLLSSKWSVDVLLALGDGTRRYHELLEDLAPISEKVLTQTLRAMERDGLLVRRVHAEVPPRVEYALSPLGAHDGPAVEGARLLVADARQAGRGSARPLRRQSGVPSGVPRRPRRLAQRADQRRQPDRMVGPVLDGVADVRDRVGMLLGELLRALPALARSRRTGRARSRGAPPWPPGPRAHELAIAISFIGLPFRRASEPAPRAPGPDRRAARRQVDSPSWASPRSASATG